MNASDGAFNRVAVAFKADNSLYPIEWIEGFAVAFQRINGDFMLLAEALRHKVADVFRARIRVGIFNHQNDLFH